jgi:hypothetical protein
MFICQACGATITPAATITGMTVWAADTDGAWTAPLDCVAVGGAAAHAPRR